MIMNNIKGLMGNTTLRWLTCHLLTWPAVEPDPRYGILYFGFFSHLIVASCFSPLRFQVRVHTGHWNLNKVLKQNELRLLGKSARSGGRECENPSQIWANNSLSASYSDFGLETQTESPVCSRVTTATIRSEQNPARNGVRREGGREGREGQTWDPALSVLRVNVYWIQGVHRWRFPDPSSAPLFECTSGALPETTHRHCILSKYTWLKPPFHHQLLLSELACVCLFRPHTWVLSPTGLHLLTNVVLKSFLKNEHEGNLTNEKQKKQWRYAIISHESKYWAALFPLKVFFF